MSVVKLQTEKRLSTFLKVVSLIIKYIICVLAFYPNPILYGNICQAKKNKNNA